MKKIYVEGNYLIINNEIDVAEFPLIGTEFDNTNGYITIKINQTYYPILHADVPTFFDLSGLIAYSVSTLETFLRNNTSPAGGSGGGGGGGGGDASANNQLLGNASLSSIDTKLSSQATAAHQVTAQTSLNSIVTNQGTDNTGITQVNTGTGLKGWLSGIYKRLTDALTNTTAPFTRITDGTTNVTINPASTVVLPSSVSLPVSILPNNNLVKITDGTTLGTIKPASTAAVATDPALVVAISPNNALSINQTQVNGVAVSVNSGINGTGVQRVTIATDQASIPTNQTIGTSGFSKITDGTNTATVKPASTTSVAGDSSLVVALNPVSNLIRLTDATTTLSINQASTVVSATSTSMPVSFLPNNNLIKVSDGTNTATVKPASTATVAGDTSIVVQTSINTPTMGTTVPATAPVRMEMVGGVFTTSGVTLTTGQSAALQMNSDGSLKVSTLLRASVTQVNGTITTGGTSQTLFVADSARNGFELQNTSNSDLYFNLSGTAVIGSSFKLAPGGAYNTPTDFAPTAAVRIVGATTGQAFSCYEY